MQRSSRFSEVGPVAADKVPGEISAVDIVRDIDDSTESVLGTKSGYGVVQIPAEKRERQIVEIIYTASFRL